MSDRELLMRYARDGDRAALGEVVRRYISFVYSAARRQVRDEHLAEDVTQAVFILLARKAGTIRSDAALAAWLFSVTRYAANSAKRMQSRRAFHERRAAEVKAMMRDAGPDDELLPMLDDAIANLSESDRRGVLLSYFHRKTYREVGSALGVSEEAARKRVSRAVDRMRAFFAQRGADASASSLASIMTGQAMLAAPSHLLAPSANVAAITHSFASQAIVKGAGKMLLWSSLKPLAAAAAFVVVITGVVVGQVMLHQDQTRPQAAQVAAAPGAAAPEAVDLGDGVSVEFVAIAPIDRYDWHTPSGAPAPKDIVEHMLAQLARTEIIMPNPAYRALVRVTAPPDANANVTVSTATSANVHGESDKEGEFPFLAQFSAPRDGNSVDIKVQIAAGEWLSVAGNDHLDNAGVSIYGSEHGGVAFSEMIESEGKPAIYVSTELSRQPWRVVALDDAGNVLGIHPGGEASAGTMLSTCKAVFNVERDRINKIEVQTRQYNKIVTLRNCTLDPKKPTQPKIEIKQ